MKTTISPGAMRAAREMFKVFDQPPDPFQLLDAAETIDRETHCAEMLAALEELLDVETMIEKTPAGFCIFRFTQDAVVRARAIIAKVKGAS